LVQFLLVAACDFVKDQQAEEVGVGQLAVDGLAVAGLQRIQPYFRNSTQILQISPLTGFITY